MTHWAIQFRVNSLKVIRVRVNEKSLHANFLKIFDENFWKFFTSKFSLSEFSIFELCWTWREHIADDVIAWLIGYDSWSTALVLSVGNPHGVRRKDFLGGWKRNIKRLKRAPSWGKTRFGMIVITWHNKDHVGLYILGHVGGFYNIEVMSVFRFMIYSISCGRRFINFLWFSSIFHLFEMRKTLVRENPNLSWICCFKNHRFESLTIIIIKFFVKSKRKFRYGFILWIVILAKIWMCQGFINCDTSENKGIVSSSWFSISLTCVD